MPEYVYALHDFQPENEDEVAFHPGERIEVLEKDDEFGDGWWKVSTLIRLRQFPEPLSYHLHSPLFDYLNVVLIIYCQGP